MSEAETMDAVGWPEERFGAIGICTATSRYHTTTSLGIRFPAMIRENPVRPWRL